MYNPRRPAAAALVAGLLWAAITVAQPPVPRAEVPAVPMPVLEAAPPRTTIPPRNSGPPPEPIPGTAEAATAPLESSVARPR